jgi:hypothetical protein
MFIRLAVVLSLAAAPMGCQSKSASSGAGDEQWISIFNGHNLDGWTPKFAGRPLGENDRDTFRVHDGVLQVCYDDAETFDEAFGHLFYDVPQSRYKLRLEYRFTGEQTPGAPGWAFRNSGVMIHGQDPKTMRVDQLFPVCIEVQLLGGNGIDDRPTANLCTPGTHVVIDNQVDRRHCIDSFSPTYHGDEWIEVEIEVYGAQIVRHLVNGIEVMVYTLPQLDPADPDAAAWIARRDGEMLLRGGTISLQAESHPCEFRNIQLLVLE